MSSSKYFAWHYTSVPLIKAPLKYFLFYSGAVQCLTIFHAIQILKLYLWDWCFCCLEKKGVTKIGQVKIEGAALAKSCFADYV